MVSVDIPMCIDTVRFFAECIDKVTGSITANRIRRYEHSAARADWCRWVYFAMELSLAHGHFGKSAPSLAAGNSTILKPAEQSPLSSYRAAELFVEAGGPAGALQVVNGMGEEAGQPVSAPYGCFQNQLHWLNRSRQVDACVLR